MSYLALNRGHLSMLLYIMMTALSSMLIHETTQVVSPIEAACYTFICCVLFYSFFIFRRKQLLSRIMQQFYPVCMLNITTAICWLLTFYSLKVLSPELYLFVYLTAMPISAAILYKHNLLSAFFMLITLIVLLASFHAGTQWISVLLAFLGGVSGTVYSMFSKSITAHFQPAEILFLRFMLIILVTLIVCVKTNVWHLMPLSYYERFFMLAFISVILPLTFFQLSIHYLPVTQVLHFLPFVPLLCYLLSLASGSIELQPLQFASAAVMSWVMYSNIKSGS